jgi:UDP:flavonoid glycosyltransferase YjiC (YdhE family)
MTTTRNYLFALVDGGGTVPPELGTVRRLVERGHRVTVLAEDSMAEQVRGTGATFRPWTTAPNRPDNDPEHAPYRDWECTNPMQMFRMVLDAQFVGPAPAYAADVLDAVAEDRPELIVCSFFAIGAMVGAEAAGLPYDVLFPNPYLLPAPGMPPVGLGLQPATGRLGRLRDRTLNGFTGRLWAKGLPRLNDLRVGHALAPLDAFFDQVLGARRILVLTSADFDFPADLPANVRYVGPVLDDPAWSAGPWSTPAGDAPLVLVALSSTFQDHGDCLQRIVDGLATLPVRALVTTGPAVDPDTLHAPGNVMVVRAAPHSEVLAEAAAVVTHGGHGTVIRSLAADVPMVVLHHGRDQADNAARVTARHAGIAVKRTASAAGIATAVRSLLDDPSYREGAARLGHAVRRDAQRGALVQELEDLPAPAVARG